MEHLPVLLREVVEYLNIKKGGIYVDATVGQGGHSAEILKHLGSGRLICIDRDADALDSARQRLQDDERCIFKKARFSEMTSVLNELDISGVDGVLMDFGLSMTQLRAPDRGFSFESDEPLDMRMDQDETLTARDIVNTWNERDLANLIFEFGEERASRRIAKAIVFKRRKKSVQTCSELAEIIKSAIPGRGRRHPATKTFQALRIAVNEELKEIEEGLVAALESTNPGGRMVVIAYHSLEDRIVKNFMKAALKEGKVSLLTKKPLTPGRDEMRNNPSARSAKFRVSEVL